MRCSICGQDAIGICRHCGVALCEEHFAEAEAFAIGGTKAYGCLHRPGTRKTTRGANRDESASVRVRQAV